MKTLTLTNAQLAFIENALAQATIANCDLRDAIRAEAGYATVACDILEMRIGFAFDIAEKVQNLRLEPSLIEDAVLA